MTLGVLNRYVGNVGISQTSEVLCCLRMRRSDLTALGCRGGCLAAVPSPCYCPHQSISV